ncbi:hypothetical protein GUJ93_ZPchr0007g5497 [Zizania palustris]|uniref:B-block binding subunit of TFIIIC domain-containing protein n=1 Tax=Zizania palustris TaxID=103762 RepID=A0A8J5TCP8_ZIZPA|nr:hypothetical protein GUJ93_ZPchr0007g5497 [Zizania palustris]
MDALVSAALEEVCARLSAGLPVTDLWTALHGVLEAAGLPIGPVVKRAVWARLIVLPVISVVLGEGDGEGEGAPFDSKMNVEEAERRGMRLVASAALRDSFLGMYDRRFAKSELSAVQKATLERVGASRTSGVTQNDLCKNFRMKGNNFHFIVKSLQSQRYAKDLNMNSHQRIEIIKPELLGSNEETNIDALQDGTFGVNYNNDVSIHDYLPAMKAICDKLEEASGKALVVSDIKTDLNYRMTCGHRAWRNVLHRLRDAELVEEFNAEVDDKVVCCLRLLKKFDPNEFLPKPQISNYKLGKKGQGTDQVMELPLENCIYDMISAQGPKGITLVELGKRLGHNNSKRLHKRVSSMLERFNLIWEAEVPDKTSQYRVWTSKNFSHYKDVPSKGSGSPRPQCDLCVNNKLLFEEECYDKPIGSHLLSNHEACVGASQLLEQDKSALGKRKRWHCHTSIRDDQRRKRILHMLKKKKFVLMVELHKWLERLEKENGKTMDKNTLTSTIKKLQIEGSCKCIKASVPLVTDYSRNRLVDVILHSSVGDLSMELPIKEMPLELFLQVVGSAKKIDSVITKYSLGETLSEIPTKEYDQLMDTHAKGRLSRLITILDKLKLIQLAKESVEDSGVRSDAVPTYSLVLRPYIEEPTPRILPSSHIDVNHHPKYRHDFVLSKQESVDAYWETLEYCYLTAGFAEPSSAFPGCSVPEVSHPRSWSSLRVMTTEQRLELQQRVMNVMEKGKLSYKDCRIIAKELNLSVQQVLCVTQSQRKVSSRLTSQKRKRSADEITLKFVKQKVEDSGSAEQRSTQSIPNEEVSEIISPSTDLPEQHYRLVCKTGSTHTYHIDSPVHTDEDKESSPMISQSTLVRRCMRSSKKKGRCMEQKKFFWTYESDRKLLMIYTRYRATHGAKSSRVDWNSLSDLPASPAACCKRMSYLRATKNNIRLAILSSSTGIILKIRK